MNILLDTTVLVDVLRARRDTRTMLGKLVTAGHSLSTAAVNVAEIYAGIREGEESETERFLAMLHCYPLTEGIARRAGLLKRDSSRKGRTLTVTDMMVAATALEHGLLLMTDNRKDFPIAELKFHP